jgi:16S rRNA (adenine1518-N6/adenine1519-N6)-dimethyltransferase
LRVAAQLRPARLVVADALDFDWSRLRAGSRIAGNLPYNVATAILERLLRSDRWDRAAFLVQLEVAQRLAASPGSKQYGALSVLVAARAEVRILGKVAPGAFTPPPKVESAFVGLVPRSVDPRAEGPKLAWLVRGVFSHRRKTIANALGHLIGDAASRQALAQAAIDPGVRPEQVPLAAWLALVEAVVPASTG